MKKSFLKLIVFSLFGVELYPIGAVAMEGADTADAAEKPQRLKRAVRFNKVIEVREFEKEESLCEIEDFNDLAVKVLSHVGIGEFEEAESIFRDVFTHSDYNAPENQYLRRDLIKAYIITHCEMENYLKSFEAMLKTKVFCLLEMALCLFALGDEAEALKWEACIPKEQVLFHRYLERKRQACDWKENIQSTLAIDIFERKYKQSTTVRIDFQTVGHAEERKICSDNSDQSPSASGDVVSIGNSNPGAPQDI